MISSGSTQRTDVEMLSLHKSGLLHASRVYEYTKNNCRKFGAMPLSPCLPYVVSATRKTRNTNALFVC